MPPLVADRPTSPSGRRSLSLGTKLGLGFALLTFLSVAVGGVALERMSA